MDALISPKPSNRVIQPRLQLPATPVPHHRLLRCQFRSRPTPTTFTGKETLRGTPGAAGRSHMQTPSVLSSATSYRKKHGNGVRSPAASLFDFLEDTINASLETFPLHPSVDPEHVLAGNFAPVDELPPTACRVVRGSIPDCLRGGAYVRIGPNPRHPPRGPHHHFDGDGMLHSVLLPIADTKAGSPTPMFSSRYVRTQKHEVESDAGGPVLPNLFCLRGLSGAARLATFLVRTIVTREVDLRMGITPTNANLFLFGDKLLALGDADFPYHIYVSPEDGDISTVGRWEIDRKFFRGLAAHPKIDKDTGEVFALRYGFLPPFLSYFWFDREHEQQQDVPITSVPRLSVFHDFAVTKNYAVLADSQLVMDPLGMALGGAMFRFDPAKVPRVGLLPRHAVPGNEPTWFEVPGFNPLHIMNAWEDGGSVVLVAPNWFNMEHLVDRMELIYGHMEMVRLDLEKKIVTRTPLSTENLDLGSINSAYLGKKSRYAFMALAADKVPKIKGVVKLDLKLVEERRDCLVAKREYGPGIFGGEPLFVARNDQEIGGGGEDDGYVVTYVHDENKGESRFVVMDARSPQLETVAEVALPRRVPYGFHGIFLRREELGSQRPLNGMLRRVKGRNASSKT